MEGRAFRLRPVALEDAEFILQLRSDPARSRYLHPCAPDLAAQTEWLEKYFDRPGDYYFVIERRDGLEKHGTAGIYRVDFGELTAEWGRWIVQPGSAAALESVTLIYRVAFEVLQLESIYCRTVAENRTAMEIHRRFGLEPVRTLPRYFESDGRRLDAVEARMTGESWRSRRLQRA
jgi:RimJ/RimL family protein N-acetyltransferase